MYMKCRECGLILKSKEVRKSKQLTYAVNANEWHDCIDGRGSSKPNIELDNSEKTVIGYCGCKGWP